MSVKLVDKKLLYQGYAKLEQWSVEDHGVKKQLEVIGRGDSACLLPYDERGQTLLLVQQFRPGSYPEETYLTELIAGIIDDNESASSAIIREAKEEANLDLDESQLENHGCFHLSPGILVECSHIFSYPLSLSNIDLTFKGGLASEGELIRLQTMTFEKANALLKQPGKTSITTAFAISTLLHRLSHWPI